MTSTLQARRARFVTDGVAAASPQTLLVLLVDRLVLDLGRAESAQRAGDPTTANTQLQHAQLIVTELAAALDTTAWAAGQGLASLYAWLQSEVVQANITRDAERTAACRALVEPLADAWRQAASGIAPAAAASTTVSLGGTA